MPDYTLIFDGGSYGNPGPGYGSYALIRHKDGRRRIVRLEFDDVTSNEAEYKTLIAGMEDLANEVGREARKLTVEVCGDSKLVINQVKSTWKAKDERMRAYRNRVCELINRFAACNVKLLSRQESVKVLGH